MTNKVLGGGSLDGSLGLNPDFSTLTIPLGRVVQSVDNEGYIQYWIIEETLKAGGNALANGLYANSTTLKEVAGGVSKLSVQNRQAIEAAYKAQGYNNVFFFEDGFTYTESNDVGIYEDGTAWTYGDADALPVTIAAGTVPSAPDYQVAYNSAEFVVNANGGSAQDFMNSTPERLSISEISTKNPSVGLVFSVSDRKNELFTVATGETPNSANIVDIGNSKQLVLSEYEGIDVAAYGLIAGSVSDQSTRLAAVEASQVDNFRLFGDYIATGVSALSKNYTGNGLIRIGSGKRLIVGELKSKVTNFSSDNDDASTQRASGVWLLDNGDGIEEFPEGGIHNLIAGGARKGLYRSKYKAYANLSVSIGPKHTTEGLATQFLGISKHALRPDVLSYTYTHSSGILVYSYPSYYLDQRDIAVYWPTKTDGNRKVLGVDYTITDGVGKSDPPFYNGLSQEVDSGYVSATINLINQPNNGESIIIDTLGNSHNGSIGGADQHFWGNYQFHGGGLGVRYTAEATRASGIGGFQHYISGSHYAALSGRDIVGEGNYSANICGRNLTVSGDYSWGAGRFNEITADYARVEGLNSKTDGQYGSAIGNRAHSYVRGMHAKSSHTFGSLGDCQISSFTLARSITSVTGAPTPLLLDGFAQSYVIPENKKVTIKGLVIAGEEGGGDTSSYSFEGYISRGAGSTASGVITANVIFESDPLSDLTFNITTGGTLQVLASTPVGKTYRWVCNVDLVEVGT